MSQSKLLNYISHLMSDDDALNRYLADPITDAEEKHGLTKAERAVLRRTVHHMSNNSLNGYSLVRDLNSYRRSLRLLQNVLHNVGVEMMGNTQTSKGQSSSYYGFLLYYPADIDSSYSGQTIDVSNLSNQQLEDKYGNPFGNTVIYTSTLSESTDEYSVQDILDNVKNNPYFSFDYGQTTPDKDGNIYVNSVTFKDRIKNINDAITIKCDLPESLSTDYAFWFYSLKNKLASPIPAPITGEEGEGINKYMMGETQIAVQLQVFAPDPQYGFMPCDPGHNNEFAKRKKAAAQKA